jgi:hypothetical protein
MRSANHGRSVWAVDPPAGALGSRLAVLAIVLVLGCGLTACSNPHLAGGSAATTRASTTPAPMWRTLVNHLNMAPDLVDCPSSTMCVFTGSTPATAPMTNQYSSPRYQDAVSVSTGPFTPGSAITGKLTTISTGSGHWMYPSCPSTTLCVLATYGAVYASTDPVAGSWTSEVTAPSNSNDSFSDISCPTVTFCAVATRGGAVYVSHSPTGGPSTWVRAQVTPTPVQYLLSISCPSPEMCVAGGVGPDQVSSWIGASMDPGSETPRWTGAVVPYPPSRRAQGPGEWAVGELGCPTTSFCVAATALNRPRTCMTARNGPTVGPPTEFRHPPAHPGPCRFS